MNKKYEMLLFAFETRIIFKIELILDFKKTNKIEKKLIFN